MFGRHSGRDLNESRSRISGSDLSVLKTESGVCDGTIDKVKSNPLSVESHSHDECAM